MARMSETPADGSRAIVLACIKRLCDRSEKRVANYCDIVSESGISPHAVKDRCKELVESQEIERVSRGVYGAVKVFAPPRPISKTVLADGEVVLEIGDDVVHLTPQEERLLRGMFGSATVELQQVAAPVVQQQQQQAVAPVIMTLDDIAALFNVSRRVARDKITKDPGFPATVPGSTERKPMWAKATIMEYLCVSA
jgi:hypothetical protein